MFGFLVLVFWFLVVEVLGVFDLEAWMLRDYDQDRRLSVKGVGGWNTLHGRLNFGGILCWLKKIVERIIGCCSTFFHLHFSKTANKTTSYDLRVILRLLKISRKDGSNL
jgi:hypothetical protein